MTCAAVAFRPLTASFATAPATSTAAADASKAADAALKAAKDKREATRKTIPMQRLGVAQDCAGTFLYLASDAASGYVTGQVIAVDGGTTMSGYGLGPAPAKLSL